MKYADLSARIIAVCIRVHEKLGPGLLESVYEAAICYEFRKVGIEYKRQVDIPVKYDGVELGIGFRGDIIVEDKILLELKSVEGVTKVHFKTVLSYMRQMGIDVGLVINFNNAVLKEGISRIVDEEWQSKFGNNKQVGSD